MSQQISREDLRKKFSEIQTEVDSTAETVKIPVIAVAGGLLLAAVGLSHQLGQRKAKKQTTIVEIRRE